MVFAVYSYISGTFLNHLLFVSKYFGGFIKETKGKIMAVSCILILTDTMLIISISL